MLTWVSIYWFSRDGPAASLRIYREMFEKGPQSVDLSQTVTIPTGVSMFPQEVAYLPSP